jgi:hypothetical protein
MSFGLVENKKEYWEEEKEEEDPMKSQECNFWQKFQDSIHAQ